VFLFVVAIHAMAVFLAIRATPIHRLNALTPADEITLLYLPAGPAPAEQRPSPASLPRPTAQQRDHPDKATPITPQAQQNLPPAQIIDWDKEAELAAENAIKPDGYRNLSGLSPRQLKWIADNHYEPAPPGIDWKRPVLDHTSDGLLIIHIGDHCVLMAGIFLCGAGKK
jgi:hypothetical protein